MLGLTRGAKPPIDDLSLVDHIVVVVGGLKARRGSGGTVDVYRGEASAANEVMVVVADPRFVERGATRRLDPPQDSCGREGIQIVENRLPRKGGQPPSRGSDNELGVHVLTLEIDRFDNGEPLRGDAQIGLPKSLFDLRMHVDMLPRNLDEIQIRSSDRKRWVGFLCCLGSFAMAERDSE